MGSRQRSRFAEVQSGSRYRRWTIATGRWHARPLSKDRDATMLSRVKLAASVALLAILLAGCGSAKNKSAASTPAATTTAPVPKPGPTQHFHSRPDLKPPLVRVQTPAHGTAPGYLFLAPKMVVAQAGP